MPPMRVGGLNGYPQVLRELGKLNFEERGYKGF